MKNAVLNDMEIRIEHALFGLMREQAKSYLYIYKHTRHRQSPLETEFSPPQVEQILFRKNHKILVFG